MNPKEIVFGPFLRRTAEPRAIEPHIEETGWGIQYAMPEEERCLPVYRCSESGGSEFADYYIREEELPFGVDCLNMQVGNFVGGPYIAVSAFLAGLYKRFSGLRPVEELLADFYDRLPVADTTINSKAASEYPLKANVHAAGYRVSYVFPDGRYIRVGVDWVFPQATATQSHAGHLSVGNLMFRPTPDRTLGNGRWLPKREQFVERLLCDRLARLVGNIPAKMFDEDAKCRMLDGFDWTPLAQMTNQQARLARIDFIRKHPELVNDTKALARELKDAGLYSRETSVHQIRKFLASLISAASRPS